MAASQRLRRRIGGGERMSTGIADTEQTNVLELTVEQNAPLDSETAVSNDAKWFTGNDDQQGS